MNPAEEDPPYQSTCIQLDTALGRVYLEHIRRMAEERYGRAYWSPHDDDPWGTIGLTIVNEKGWPIAPTDFLSWLIFGSDPLPSRVPSMPDPAELAATIARLRDVAPRLAEVRTEIFRVMAKAESYLNSIPYRVSTFARPAALPSLAWGERWGKWWLHQSNGHDTARIDLGHLETPDLIRCAAELPELFEAIGAHCERIIFDYDNARESLDRIDSAIPPIPPGG